MGGALKKGINQTYGGGIEREYKRYNTRTKMNVIELNSNE